MASRKPKRVGIYTRTTDARWRDDGPTQEDDCLALCDKRRWVSVELYADLDADGGKEHRPELARLFADAADGRFDIVLVSSIDRLESVTVDLEATLERLDELGVEFHSVLDGVGEVTLASVVAQREEREALSRRVEERRCGPSRQVQRQLAEAGRVGNGGPRPFGFEGDRKTIKKDEARLIRAAAKRVLGGATPVDIRRSWESRGVPTVTGADWSTTAIRKLLTSPRVAGLRLHRDVGEVPAEWEAIIERETWDRLCELLPDPARRRASAG